MRTAVLFAICVLSLGVPGQAQDTPQTVSKPGNGVMAPRLLKEVKPNYSPQAIRDRVQGTVRMEVVVNTDGTPGEVRVVKPLEPSLDEEAVKALKQWRFMPGTKDGQPVAVMVDVEMSFTLRSRGPRLGSPEVYIAGDGVTLPKLVYETKPIYPDEARNASVEGMVSLECVVLPDGGVGDIRVTKSLEPKLDIEATRAVAQWRFEPGTKDGRAVPVQVTIEVEFRLR